MSTTATAWLIIYGVGCLLTLFKNPFYGLLTYLFEYFNHPPLYWWGKGLPDLRWSLLISAITLTAFFVHRDHLPQIRIKIAPAKWLIALLSTAVFVTFLFAVSFDDSQAALIKLIKLGVFYFLIVNLIRTKKQYHIFVWTIILGCFLFGWRAYQDPSLSGGRLENFGGPDTASSNYLATLMIVPLPFIGYYFFAGNRWEKILSILAVPFILNTIILCNSRGAIVGMAAAAVFSLLLSKGKIRLWIVLGLLLGSFLFVRLADQRFWDRMGTIQDAYQGDTSSIGRVQAWKGALKLMQDHPLGVGGDGFNILSPIYASEFVKASGGRPRSVHNLYLLVGSEWGVPGLFFFCAFLISTIVQLHRIRREQPKNNTEKRLQIESIAVEVALIGFLVDGIFGSRLYTESMYWLCALAPVLRNIHDKESVVISETTVEEGNILSNTIMEILVRRQLKKAQRKSQVNEGGLEYDT